MSDEVLACRNSNRGSPQFTMRFHSWRNCCK